MNSFNNEIILQISKYLDIKSIINFSNVSKFINNIKLYRLFYGYIFKNRFGLSCVQNVKYFSLNYNYKFVEYLKDLLLCLNLNISKNNNLKKYTFGYTSYSYTLISLSLNQTKIFWKREAKKKHKIYKVRICNIYKIPLFKKRFYKKNLGLNLLAIIY